VRERERDHRKSKLIECLALTNLRKLREQEREKERKREGEREIERERKRERKKERENGQNGESGH
jgi:hypothetical protein